ncbi:helix-turn-helix domain-containing protein [Streptosporangium sp. NPDC002524]|uniref:helix-turn-helix domain-containing protein n=1 Tax=Streptosporangium sp. NPDC002524 TaxID=3154537 RepID=UPI003318225E
MLMASLLRKHVRVSGAERENLVAEMKPRCLAGKSVRMLATAAGRSYEFVHRLLAEAGVALRTAEGGRLDLTAQPVGQDV